MTLTVAVVVFSTVAVLAVAALVQNYRARGRRPPATEYCNHPANQPTIAYIGAGQYSCLCRHCDDRAIIPALSRDEARRKYSAHPCAAMPAPSTPQK